MTRRQMIADVISQAREAQVDAQGGYARVEADAKGHERTLGRLAEKAALKIVRLEAELAVAQAELKGEKAGAAVLRRKLRNTQQQLYAARKRRDLWYTRATGHSPQEGRGARKAAA